MIVKCHTRCWDAKTCKRYYPGDQDDINPLEPIAMYFTFPPGTEVYDKIRAKGRTGSNVITTRIVPGLKIKKDEFEAVEIEIEHKKPGRPPKKEKETETSLDS